MIGRGSRNSGGGVALPLGGGLAGREGIVEIGRVRGISMRGIAGRGVSARDTADLGTGPPGIGIFVPGRELPADEGFEVGFGVTGGFGEAGAGGDAAAGGAATGIEGNGAPDWPARAGGGEAGTEAGGAPVYGFSTVSATTSIKRSANSIQSPSPTISTPDVGRPLRRVEAEPARSSIQSVSGSNSRKTH